jgi:hypothetical protein
MSLPFIVQGGYHHIGLGKGYIRMVHEKVIMAFVGQHT